MLIMKYIGQETTYKVSFSKISENVVQIVGNFPIETNGFQLSREGKNDYEKMNYYNFRTVYREIEGGVQFSNDGSIFIPTIPKVLFSSGIGGTIEGIIEQEVNDYSELVIPNPVPDDNYEFERWVPDIQTEGKIENNISFYATFKSLLPPPEPVPSIEERVTAVEEQSAMLTSCVLEMSEVIYA